MNVQVHTHVKTITQWNVKAYVSVFDKKAHWSLLVNFELAVLGGRTVDELSVALRCTSIAAPLPEICLLNMQ